MLRSLKLENYRCFNTFELNPLGRINLLVGENNSGKTSILEALYLLKSPVNLDPLREIMSTRSEYLIPDEQGGDRELDIAHLFYGHVINTNELISITADQDILSQNNKETHKQEILKVSISSSDPVAYPDLQDALLFEWLGFDENNQDLKFPLSVQNGLKLDRITRLRRFSKTQNSKAQYINSRSLISTFMIELFERVVLTPEESLIIEALKTIEPKIERIASATSLQSRYDSSRGGFLVLLSSSDQRIPIGSMGDGMWRILALTLAMVNAKDGVLLVDEIDTGLHFSAMTDMWRLIWKTAQDLNVQVFATTHSRDCWTSLAEVAYQEQVGEEDITIHRIEKGKLKSVVFTESEIVIAAERNIEVR